LTEGCVASSSKLFLYNLNVLERNGFVVTMKGNASKACTRPTSRLGSSERAYDADSRSESRVKGKPNDNNLLRVSGLGGFWEYLESRSASSDDVSWG